MESLQEQMRARDNLLSEANELLKIFSASQRTVRAR
jgi:hypothetical protein